MKISVCYCKLALAAVLMSEDQCVLLRAHFGRCSDLTTFGTDIREDFISRTTSAAARDIASREEFLFLLFLLAKLLCLFLPTSCTVWNGQAQVEENKTRDEVAVSTEVEMRPIGEQLKVSSKT